MTWKEIILPVLKTPKLQETKKYIKKRREETNVYPESKDVFRAFDLCPYEETYVVILGQDPYPQPGVADGLAFSSRATKRPKSLEVIFKEIYKDLNIQYYHNVTLDEFFPTNRLDNWCKNGILLLNTILTVEEGKPLSHKDIGWEVLIDEVFRALNKLKHQVVFLLWGKNAQAYTEKITNPRHIYFEAPHPAAELYNPSGDKFSGCRHFSIIRDIVPMNRGTNIYKTAEIDSAFDKEKAKKIVMESYPKNAKQICEYIDKELVIHIPFNRDQYWKEIHKFEENLSTKFEN